MSETLKIGWATPWNDRSAIAKFSQLVVAELETRGVEVDILRLEIGAEAELPPLPVSGGRTARFAYEFSIEELTAFDVVFANIGDYSLFHGQIFDLLFRTPCVTVVHDADLTNIANHLCEMLGEGGLRYGARAAALAADDGPAEGRSARLLRWLGAASCGGIVHARHYLDRFEPFCAGEVAVAPLAYPDIGEIPHRPSADGRLRLATIGVVNANKRIAEVMRALSLSPKLTKGAAYKVIGAVTDRERQRLDALAESLGIPPVVFTGWVDDDELKRQLESVDIVSCLRYPITEGASASLIVGMQSGRPVLVSDHGCYADVPDEFVLKCQPGDEAPDVRRHLERLLQTPGEALVLGQAARAFALKYFSAARYADAVLDLAPRAAAARPLVAVAGAVSGILNCLDTRDDDPLIERLARNMVQMLGEA